MRRLALSTLLALAAAGGCSSQANTYSYVRLKIDVDLATVDDDTRLKINACGVTVTGLGGAHNDSFQLPNCSLAKTPYNLETIEYATLSSQGMLRFTVNALNIKKENVAVGISPDIAIVSGQTVDSSVSLKGVTAAPDGGTPDGGGEAGAD